MINIVFNKKILIIFCLLTVCLFPNENEQAVTEDNRYIVKWVSSFSSRKELKITTGFLRKVKNFIFGSDEFTLSKPVNLFADDTNRYCILDQGLNSIVLIDRRDSRYEKLDPEENFLPSLVGIDRLDENRFLVTDSKTGKLYVLDFSVMSISILNDSLLLSQPTGIAINKAKMEIIVTETNHHRLTVLNYKGEILRTIGERGRDSLQFNFPTYLTFDRNNNLYVVDALNYRVQIFDENYNLKHIFGEQGDASGYIAAAKGIAVDSFGHIYLVDSRLHAVQVFKQDGTFLSVFGSPGKDQGEFWMPSGISIDKNNLIYVADSYNSRIQIFQLQENK